MSYVVKFKLNTICSGQGFLVRFIGIIAGIYRANQNNSPLLPLSMRRNYSVTCGDIYLTHLVLYGRFVGVCPKGPEVPEDRLDGKPIDQRRCERSHPL
jgi:hypothetical protein